MKKKNYWFAIITLVLCLGVMATGIYAAKQATLKMGGSLGFTMHECMIEVSGKISNYAVKDENDAYSKQDKTIEKAIMGSETTQTTTEIDLGDLQFYYGYDMIFEFSFKNVGSTSVIALLTLDLKGKETQISQVQSALYDVLPLAKAITPKGFTTFSFALHLNNNELLESFDFDITVEFEEAKDLGGETVKMFTPAEVEEIKTDIEAAISAQNSSFTFDYGTTKTYVEEFPYYVEMGTDPATGDALRWLVVGKDFFGRLSEKDKIILKSGAMLNKDYFLISEMILDVDPNNDSINNMWVCNQWTTSNGKYITKYGTVTTDYATTNARDFLKGKTPVYANGTLGNNSESCEPDTTTSLTPFETIYNITSSPLSSKIQARSLTDLYLDLSCAVPTSTTSYSIDTTADRFWLPSFNDLSSMGNIDHPFINDKPYTKTILCKTNFNSSWDSYYLVRERYNAYNSDWDTGRYATNAGNLSVYSALDFVGSEAGIRPACKI